MGIFLLIHPLPKSQQEQTIRNADCADDADAHGYDLSGLKTTESAMNLRYVDEHEKINIGCRVILIYLV